MLDDVFLVVWTHLSIGTHCAVQELRQTNLPFGFGGTDTGLQLKDGRTRSFD